MSKIIIYDKSFKKIGTYTRKNVHTNGYWHRGIQLNIYHRGKILVQQRSARCDIAWNLYDQSLAVQMVEKDNEDEYKALKRGMLDELGLDIDLLPKPQKVAGPCKIKKTYVYAPELINNEFISLYRINLKRMLEFKINRDKINSIDWVDANKLKKDVVANPDNYTKTILFWIKKGHI